MSNYETVYRIVLPDFVLRTHDAESAEQYSNDGYEVNAVVTLR